MAAILSRGRWVKCEMSWYIDVEFDGWDTLRQKVYITGNIKSVTCIYMSSEGYEKIWWQNTPCLVSTDRYDESHASPFIRQTEFVQGQK